MVNQGPLLSFQTQAALRTIGEHLRIARLRRGDSEETAATRTGVSRQTWRRLEAGNPGVKMGLLLEALVIYGFAEQVFELGHPDLDTVGQSMDAARRPVRGTTKPQGRER